MRTRGHVIRDPTTTDLARLRRIGKRGVGIFFPVAAPLKKRTRCNAHSQQHDTRSETILRVPDHVAGYQWNCGSLVNTSGHEAFQLVPQLIGLYAKRTRES